MGLADIRLLHPPSAMKLNTHLKERCFTACARKEMEVGDSVILGCFNPLLIQQDQPVSGLKPLFLYDRSSFGNEVRYKYESRPMKWNQETRKGMYHTRHVLNVFIHTRKIELYIDAESNSE